MSTFKVEIREVESVMDHPNADKLEIVRLKNLGYQFITQKGLYSIGSKVVYFPVDAILPDELANRLGVTEMLKKGKRIKTVKLRGELSEGLLADPKLFGRSGFPVYTNLTEVLGVTKWEDEPIFQAAGSVLRTLPYSKYDIENAERHGNLLPYFDSVAITEKLEGTNASFSKIDGKVHVCSRNHSVDEGDNIYWEMFKKYHLEHHLEDDMVIWGEIVGPGIQKNVYGLEKRELFVFDVQVDGSYLDSEELYDEEADWPFDLVPLIHMGKLPENLKDYSNAKSLLGDTLREGIVIKHNPELSLDGFGRLILKQKNPEYLVEKK